MRKFCAVVLSSLALPTMTARAAECQSEFAAVLAAMRSSGPMRREDVVTKNGTTIEKMMVDVSPPDQLKQEVHTIGIGVFKTIVSGKSAWTIVSIKGSERPPRLMEGAAESLLRNALGLEETNAPLIECPTNGKGILTLTWKGEDKDKSVLNVAKVDAQTHIVKMLTRSTLDKFDNSRYERNSVYTIIPAFTVSPP